MECWVLRALPVCMLLLLVAMHATAQPVEEFQAHGPMDFHNKAMDTFLAMRKANPDVNLSHDGEFLQRASKHAVKRLLRKPDEMFERTKIAIDGGAEGADGGAILELPSPEGMDASLTAAVNSQGTAGGNQVMLPQEAHALAVAFNEDIGLGAIAKTGALPMGTEGEWIDLAVKKMKKENSLDYQALLWELGSEELEKQQIERGGINVTYEEELLENMYEWFTKGGGKLKYIKPAVSKEVGFELLAEEDIGDNEPVISAPLKLIMCRQTARNVLIPNRGKYLGDELSKTFDKNELWGMSIFLLHEYYKEIAGKGSKWGPFIRTLRMRFLSTRVLQEVQGTIAGHLSAKWTKGSDKFMWWSVGAEGPCSPTTGICKTKPNEKTGDTRFNIHQMRWAYWVVKQNAVRIKQIATGLEFIALIPYYNMVHKRYGSGGGLTFDLDGSVSVRVGGGHEEGMAVGIHPGNMSDSEFFLRYLRTPAVENPSTEITLSLPGVIPKGSKFHYCLKGTSKEMNRDDCKASYRSDAMFWKSKVLTEWRQMMNLPPRLQELRMWATRLHLYGGEEEMKLLSTANKAIAGLPLPVDQMPAEEQLMLLGIARNSEEAALIATGAAKPGDDFANAVSMPAPQLYSAPDPEEDYEAQRGMENLATLAIQAQNVLAAGNIGLNATRAVLNQTNEFFVHGVLPKAGLDELDNFLLKKIGMLSHCGFENDMKITLNNVTDELMCAMRVHLMNESEVHVFCPKEARVWEDNCLNVEFMNYTAISEPNELQVVSALRGSLHGLLASYPTSLGEDEAILAAQEERSAAAINKAATATVTTSTAKGKDKDKNAEDETPAGSKGGDKDKGKGKSKDGRKDKSKLSARTAKANKKSSRSRGSKDDPEEEEAEDPDTEESVDSVVSPTANDQEEEATTEKDTSSSSASSSNDESGPGPVMLAAVQLRVREKRILYSALRLLDEHEAAVRNGTVPFQLELKAQERVAADLREAERQRFLDEVKARAAERPALATLEVEMGDSKPKQNLTLEEGRDLLQTVQLFCKEHGVKANYVDTLVKALKARVVNPAPLQLMLGVIVPLTGERKILAIPEGTNFTIETGVFCARYDNTVKNPLDSEWCEALLKRVEARLTNLSFSRRVLLVVPIDAPDSRKLQLVIREGEQHDLVQFVSDFFELYHMPRESVNMMANEVHKRLPPVATTVPVSLGSRRQVVARFTLNENLTAVVEGFVNYFEAEDGIRVALLQRANYGMAPGTFML